ncbi:MAG TPA: preprotein translocase subunit SecG [Rhabdochlamydiaceae bacterium]|jgi:preprotein translocase subunit SecG
MTFLFYVSIFVFMLIAVVLCLVILVQESKSLGLGASFGGDPGESLFGTSTADVLKKFTAWLAVVFMVSCVLLSIWSTSIGLHRVKSLPAAIEELQK